MMTQILDHGIGALGKAALAAGVLAWLVGAGGAPLQAQAVGKGFAGFAADNNEPIDIESDTLEVDDGAKLAVFRGNVKAMQGTMTMRSKELNVRYSGEEGGALGSGSEITRIKAAGKVLITTAGDQSVTSDWADFDVKQQTVVIGGNVVLSQGGNVIKGDRLVINLATGQSRFEDAAGTAKARTRVRGLFMPKSGGKKKKEGGGAATGWAPSVIRAPATPR